jgi:hypothetical protein
LRQINHEQLHRLYHLAELPSIELALRRRLTQPTLNIVKCQLRQFLNWHSIEKRLCVTNVPGPSFLGHVIAKQKIGITVPAAWFAVFVSHPRQTGFGVAGWMRG